MYKRVIPCLDMKEGRVVKGVKFESLRDAGDPVECALAYEKAGADEIVLLDITATTEHRKTFLDRIEAITSRVHLPVTVGGGIRSVEDFRAVLNAGADKASVNSAAVDRPELLAELAEAFGKKAVVLAIDAKRVDGGWTVLKAGGKVDTGLDVLEWAKRGEALGAGEILLTSLDEDGVQKGYDLALTRAVADAVEIPVVASGGAGALSDFYKAISEANADAVLAASLFHDGVFTVKQVKEYLRERGIPVEL